MVSPAAAKECFADPDLCFIWSAKHSGIELFASGKFGFAASGNSVFRHALHFNDKV